MFSRLFLASIFLAAVLAQTIKQTVGTWEYKGCYRDIGPRILTFSYTIPEGNSAESCTTLCTSLGYGLAGLEYGTECWCDNYMPYGNLMPESQCNFVCPGDDTELCGAGNRLVLYQDSAAIVPSTDICITWRDVFSFQNNILQAIPKAGGAVTRLYMHTCPAGCPWTDYYNFGLMNGILTSYNSRPLVPNVGDSQAFISEFPQTAVGYNGFCAKPNPISPTGPFIGYPLFHAHYTLAACREVYIQMTPFA
ncbi:unnamed protein product [Cyclocybe aegerita]|uniref:WSC domain-containing protein n=1 Tax=Cyclocybe aegerita TaxID=1973307 RepID=A0A8S0WK56_CYCAE|nr:unnamed protein product [Cyclocybe aegerita]